MTSRPEVRESAAYEVRVRAELDDHWSEWFHGFAVSRRDDGTTALRGVVTDQSELHGLLAQVRDLGVPLVSVTTLETGPPHGVSGPCAPA